MNGLTRFLLPYLLSSEPTDKGTAWRNQRGRKTLLSLTLVWLCDTAQGVDKQEPCVLKNHYSWCHFTYLVMQKPPGSSFILGERHTQVGSSAGAAHLLNGKAGVLWQREQKSLVDQKGKSLLDLIVSKNANCESQPIDPLLFKSLKPEVSEKLPQR